MFKEALLSVVCLTYSPARSQDILLPLTMGFVLPRLETNRNLNLSNIGHNWSRATFDFHPTGQSIKRDVVMHGSAGALGYLHMRNSGYGSLSFTGPLAVGIGIELGQSLEFNHLVSLGDIARTTIYGSVIGEISYRISRWARETYDRTGNIVYGVVSVIFNPEYLIIGPTQGGLSVSVRVSW